MLALMLTPAVLSCLVLAAHFLRHGQLLASALCLAAASLAWVRQPRAPRALQAFLLLGVLEWVRTLLALLAERRTAGEPAGKLVMIIGSVIAVALLGAALAGSRRVLDRARGTAHQEPA